MRPMPAMSQSETPQVDAESEDMNIHALCGALQIIWKRWQPKPPAMRNDALNLYDAAQAEVTRLMHLSM